MYIHGYDIDEIDEAAKDILQTLAEAETPVELSLLALCRCITIIGDETDLDQACKLIDTLSEIPHDPITHVEDVDEQF